MDRSLVIHRARRGPRRFLRSLPFAYKGRAGTFGSSHPQHPPSHPLTHTHTPLFDLAMAHTLSSFDPFATHPFTNNNALERFPPPAKPSQYPRPIPSSVSQYTAGTPAHMQTPRQPSSTSKPIHCPEPRRPIALASPQQSSTSTNQRYPKPIFTPFQQDRSSPDLDEILLRKKLTQALGPVALGRDAKRGV